MTNIFKSLFVAATAILLFPACASSPATTLTKVSTGSRFPSSDKPAVPRDQLWKAVKASCLDQQPSDSPCVVVDPRQGYVLVRDTKGPTHFLLVPATPVTGIEDPQIYQDNSPNYFLAAWRQHTAISQAINKDLPRDTLGFAINPQFARSQDQLHIHMDCLKPDVITALRAHQNEFSEEWSKTPISLSNHDYRVRILDHEDLEGINPFQILKDDLQDASLMSRHTLILIGAKLPEGRNGFYLLDGTSDPSDTAHRAHGEDLLDVKCAAATLSP